MITVHANGFSLDTRAPRCGIIVFRTITYYYIILERNP